jgi:hypothetical protein
MRVANISLAAFAVQCQILTLPPPHFSIQTIHTHPVSSEEMQSEPMKKIKFLRHILVLWYLHTMAPILTALCNAYIKCNELFSYIAAVVITHILKLNIDSWHSSRPCVQWKQPQAGFFSLGLNIFRCVSYNPPDIVSYTRPSHLSRTAVRINLSIHLSQLRPNCRILLSHIWSNYSFQRVFWVSTVFS